MGLGYGVYLDGLYTKYQARSNPSIEAGKYFELKYIQLSLLNNNMTWHDISSSDLVNVHNIAQGPYGIASGNARNIMEIYFDTEIVELPYDYGFVPVQFKQGKANSKISVSYNNVLQSLTLQKTTANLDFASDNALSFELHDINGRKMLSTQYSENIQLNNSLISGIYLYTIHDSNRIIDSGKLIITK